MWEVFEHFSGDVAFQDPCDLSHGLAFGESPGDVVAGLLIVAHPGDHHVIQSGVGLPVAAPVEPVSFRLPRRGGDGSDSAEVGPGGFGSDPLGVVSCSDEEFGGGVVADPVDLEEKWVRSV